jgi:hypothetical protein
VVRLGGGGGVSVNLDGEKITILVPPTSNRNSAFHSTMNVGNCMFMASRFQECLTAINLTISVLCIYIFLRRVAYVSPDYRRNTRHKRGYEPLV